MVIRKTLIKIIRLYIFIPTTLAKIMEQCKTLWGMWKHRKLLSL